MCAPWPKEAQKPIMVYNNPVAYKVDLKPEHMAELADCKWIVAIKESSDNIRRITDLRNRWATATNCSWVWTTWPTRAWHWGATACWLAWAAPFRAKTWPFVRADEGRRFAEALKLYQWMTPCCTWMSPPNWCKTSN